MRTTNVSSMDLNLLVALEALLEDLHVSNAASRLNMSQSNMSRTLTRLRETFGDRLLVRVGNGYVKTPRAEQLEADLLPVLRTIRASVAQTSFDPKLSSAVFQIFASDYVEVALLPTLTKLFNSGAPGAKLDVRRLTKSLSKEMQDGPYDIIMGTTNANGFPRECEFEPLFTDRFVCVMCNTHPAASGELTLEEYLNSDHAVVGTARGLVNRIDSKLNMLGFNRNIVKRSPYVLASLFSLRGTGLLQSSPMRLVKLLAEPLNLVVKELPIEVDHIEYCQIWHARNTLSPAHTWFRSQIKEAAEMMDDENVF